MTAAKWRPYVVGSLLGLPVALFWLQVWKWDATIAWGAVFLYGCSGGFPVWWRTASRKTVSMAFLVGFGAALLLH
jgi:hypothetical protein